jgi:16S rRNA (guanine(966)-N(2))-methyltransferase RsmD
MPNTRPTTDIAKEGLFNMVQHQISLDGIVTLDLFGGTGSISFELASRGAKELTVVERDPAMFAFIKKTAVDLGLTGIHLVREDVFRFLRHCQDQFDFIFAGPPYALKNIEEIPGLIAERNLIAKGGWFVLEHTPRNRFEGYPLYSFSRNYGTTVFSIFRRPSEDKKEQA